MLIQRICKRFLLIMLFVGFCVMGSACGGKTCVNNGDCGANESCNDSFCVVKQNLPGSCVHGKQSYADGKTFSAGDSCNTCTCKSGKVTCTKSTCKDKCGGKLKLKCSNSSEYCELPNWSCNLPNKMGTCKPKVVSCSNENRPVCGCDEKTYKNRCLARKAGVGLGYNGKCKTGPKACKYNGKEYHLGEVFQAKDGCNSCECKGVGSVGCSLMECSQRTCKYKGKVYQDGDSFKESCNVCTCSGASQKVTCTTKACP